MADQRQPVNPTSSPCLNLYHKLWELSNLHIFGIIIQMKEATRKSQAHTTFINIGLNIQIYKYSFYHKTFDNEKNFHRLLPSVETYKVETFRAWTHTCISYISIYTPGLSCMSQGGSAD